MRKSFLITAVILSVALDCYSQAEISVDCENSWGPGRYNKITIKIAFSSSEGFARFTQDFPVGFEIVKSNVPDGDFSATDSRLNVVWMKMPKSNVTEFSYFIRPEASMNGNFDMEGSLTIINGSSYRRVVQMTGKSVEIAGSGGFSPEEMKRVPDAEIVTNVTNPGASVNPSSAGIVFRVQVSTSSSQISGDKVKRDLGLEPGEKITMVKSGKIYKYQVGGFSDYDSAEGLLRKLKSRGMKDVFIVAYNGNEQISVDQARKSK